ncbi:MAG: hypothetical protein LBQ68_01535, partial [Clostridiales bacterium]|nr:hypothetical protein [Clostridiales bacterium]
MRCTERPEYGESEPVMCKSKKGSSLSTYIRTHSSKRSTLYTVNPRKDEKGCERDGILPQYIGIISQ